MHSNVLRKDLPPTRKTAINSTDVLVMEQIRLLTINLIVDQEPYFRNKLMSVFILVSQNGKNAEEWSMKLIVPTTLVNLAKQVMKMGHIPVNRRIMVIPVSLRIQAIPVNLRILAIPLEMRMLVILVVAKTLEIPVNYPARMEDIPMNLPTKSADLQKRMGTQINKGHIPVEVKILNNLQVQPPKLHQPKIEETLFVKMMATLAMN